MCLLVLYICKGYENELLIGLFCRDLPGEYLFRFTADHGMIKPNDERGLELMNTCAAAVMREFSDLVMAYGQSDEFSFVLKRETNLFSRRARYG